VNVAPYFERGTSTSWRARPAVHGPGCQGAGLPGCPGLPVPSWLAPVVSAYKLASCAACRALTCAAVCDLLPGGC